MVHEILECIIEKLNLPSSYFSQIQSLSTSIGNSLFSFPKNCEELDYLGESVEVTAYYQEHDRKKHYANL